MSNYTKIELLNKLGELNRDVLDKLYAYSQLFLIPEEDLLVDVTMTQMVNKAHKLADKYFPEWTDRSDTDFGEFLVQLMALFSEKDFFYLNSWTNEFFIMDMSMYPNAFIKAIEQGYFPVTRKAASGKMRVRINPGAAFVLEKGTLVIKRSDTNNVYVNTSSHSIPDNASTADITVTFAEGVFQAKTGQYNGKSFRLVQPDIYYESVRVYVNDVEWSFVASFAQSGTGDKVFTTVPDEDGSVEILFGVNGYGLSPELDSTIRATYLTTKASLGNNDTLSVNVYSISESPNTRIEGDTTLLVQLTAFSGGLQQDTFRKLKENSVLYYKTKDSIINETDAENALKKLPEVTKVSASLIANIFYLRCIPSDGSIANSTLLKLLQDTLKGRVIQGYETVGVATEYINIAPLEVTCFMLSGSNLSDREAEIRQLIEDFTNPLSDAEYGVSFVRQNLLEYLISNVPGLQNVVFNTVAGGFPTDITVEKTEIMKKLSKYNAVAPYTTTTTISGGIVVSGGDITIKMLINP